MSRSLICTYFSLWNGWHRLNFLSITAPYTVTFSAATVQEASWVTSSLEKKKLLGGEIEQVSLFHRPLRFGAPRSRLEWALSDAQGRQKQPFRICSNGNQIEASWHPPLACLSMLLLYPPHHTQTHSKPAMFPTTTGSIAVSAFETQLMLDNRGLISSSTPPTNTNTHAQTHCTPLLRNTHPHPLDKNQTLQTQKRTTTVGLCSQKLLRSRT